MSMTATRRQTHAMARRLRPARLVILLPLLLTILAACGPGSGNGAGY
jgi:hypothetical protein